MLTVRSGLRGGRSGSRHLASPGDHRFAVKLSSTYSRSPWWRVWASHRIVHMFESSAAVTGSLTAPGAVVAPGDASRAATARDVLARLDDVAGSLAAVAAAADDCAGWSGSERVDVLAGLDRL